ncbi:MAG: CsgG/HfaB family protein [Rickettsiales bacterium]
MTLRARIRVIAVLLSPFLLSHCVPLADTVAKGKTSLVDSPDVLPELSELPPPTHKIAVALYRFPDKTGAFKPNDDFAVYSSAVPKSGDSVVLEAMTAAGNGKWFRVLEREGLEAVVRERMILDAAFDEWKRKNALAGEVARKLAEAKKSKPFKAPPQKAVNPDINVNPANQFARQNVFPAQKGKMPAIRVSSGALPALAAAEYVVEGGIIGYDSDVYTGGGGARFMNIGGYGEIRKDAVTVNLRFISVKTGDVVISSTVTKGVLSQKLQGSGFGYVSIDRMLEAEVGIGRNEPVFEALNLAVQAALLDVVRKGVKRGVWAYADPKRPEPKMNRVLPDLKDRDDATPSTAKKELKLPPFRKGRSEILSTPRPKYNSSKR